MSSSTNTECHHHHHHQSNNDQKSGNTKGGDMGSNNEEKEGCACSNISIMQLFHELKAKFPAIPDHIVSQYINKYYHDREACISLLSQEQERLPRGLPYPPDLMGHRNSLEETTANNVCPTTTTKSNTYTNNNNNNSVNSMLLDTKEKLVKVKKNSKFYLDEENLNIKNDGKKLLLKKSLNKVGKFAERMSKKCDFIKDNQLLVRYRKSMDDTTQGAVKLTKTKSLDSLLTETQNLTLKDASTPLSKSSKLINFHKPPLPSPKPEPPKRPTTLVSQSMKPKIPFTLPPSELNTSPTGQSVNVSLNVNVDVIPTNQNQRTVLNVNPELGWLTPQSPRSFTSVNLTLRTPTSEPQLPIDIQTSNSGLTYSSSSFDPRKGFQSSVQITVAPGAVTSGGTVSAVRMRPRSSYIPDSNLSPQVVTQRAGSLPDLATTIISNLLKRQLERKERLRIELICEKKKLSIMQQDVVTLESLPNQMYSVQLVEETRLRREIRHFQAQCERLADEVDRRSHSRAPLGETNEEFYQNIYTGQRLHVQRIPEPSEGGPPWICRMCTFSNHPLLNNCEECGMIKCARRGTSDPDLDNTSLLLDKHFLNPPLQNQIVYKNNLISTDFINNNSAEA